MGMLINGKWTKGSIIKSDKKGAYDRQPRSFRDFVSDEHPVFKPESNRYHLYVSYACPWAHRTLIYRRLKGLENHISVSVVNPDMLSEGWVFDDSYPGSTKDHLFHSKRLSEVYLKADADVTTSVTVPILWDKKTNTIVNNESSEIIRMFNKSFNELTGNIEDYYTVEFREQIDFLNEKIYEAVNNGVYRTGFARTQQAYDEAVKSLFSVLGELDDLLETNRYLTGHVITEADLRLIPTLLRFDIVYVTHFKCNIKRIKDYKNLSRYTKELYELPEIKETTNLDHIKRHYYYSHKSINPFRIIPGGPSDIF
ncbi:MAG: glutathione S-transferase family protein [Bdellovibrionaceae bacterium]|jgi:glutathionyl-hydroquinone reductase|nr:glutathione S-transferase family protein [Pseudobdellovibrionaceae bacterium]